MHTIRPGETLAERYLLVDLLDEAEDVSFWRARDRILDRDVAVHVVAVGSDKASELMAAARRSVTVADQRVLQVLDADTAGDKSYVVNEWGEGRSLDIMVGQDGPMSPQKAAWIVGQAAGAVAAAHQVGVTHGRLIPENVLLDTAGAVRLIGLAVDAALFGLPAGSQSQDVRDLAGLLHYALTGKWAGASASTVPLAPRDGARPLSPRQIRAGVPKALDGLCASVLGGQPWRGAVDISTAQGISDFLSRISGDELALTLNEVARHHRAPYADTRTHPALPVTTLGPLGGGSAAIAAAALGAQEAVAATGPAAAPDMPADSEIVAEAAEDDQVEEPDPEDQAELSELATQAGIPIFHDRTDEVTWLPAKEEPPAPPPEFEDLPVKPLFAPDPAPGEPVRRPRPGATGPTPSQEFWLVDQPSGSGLIPPARGEREEVPGRNWFRLAIVVGTAALVLLAMVFAWSLGSGSAPFGINDAPSPSPTRSTTSAPAHPAVLTGLTVSDYDPQGTPPEENPSEVPRATDGDPATGWQTLTYNDNLGTAPPALKSGVGLLVDLGSPATVSSVKLTTAGATTVSLFLTDQRPSSVAGLSPAGTGTIDGSGTIAAKGSGRYLVVWLTSLPRAGGGFRGEIDELSVLGTRP